MIDSEPEAKVSRVPSPPDRFRATIFDYTNDRTLFVEGRLAKPKVVEVSHSARQPLPSAEEFQEAAGILSREQALGPAMCAGRLQPYPPMPPLANTELPDRRTERTITVGLLPVAR